MIKASNGELGRCFASRARWLVAIVSAPTLLLNGQLSQAEELQPAAPAQQSVDISATVPRLTVEEIVQRNAEARGGHDAWRDIKSMLQIGRIERLGDVPGKERAHRAASLSTDPSKTVSFRVEMARPNKLRYELTYQGVTAIQAFDGKEGFTVQPGTAGAVARPFSEAQAHALADQFDIEGPLLSASTKGTVVALEGVDLVRGKPAYRLVLSMKGGVTRHVWVDAQSFLDVQLEGARQIGDRTWPITTLFEDFRKVGKVQIPYQIDTAVSGVHTMERVQLIKVVLNVPLEDSLFTLPRAPANTQPVSAPK